MFVYLNTHVMYCIVSYVMCVYDSPFTNSLNRYVKLLIVPVLKVSDYMELCVIEVRYILVNHSYDTFSPYFMER